MMQDSKKELNIVCALSHGLYEPWIEILKEGQQKTWLNQEFPKGFTLIHFHGTPGGRFIQFLDRTHERIRWKNRWVASVLRFLDNILLFPLISYIPRYEKSKILLDSRDVIHIKFPDTYLTYRWKFLSLLSYFVNETDADYLFVTSTASYIQPKLVLDFILGLPSENSYAGAEPYSGANFISGSNRIISRKIAKQVLSKRKRWAVGVIEDVALTQLIKSCGNNLITFPIANISSLKELESMTDKELETRYHFRLKSFQGADRMDVIIMKKLHSRIMGTGGVNSSDE